MASQHEEIVWLSSHITADDMLDGYRRGRFAMPYVGSVYLWYSPRRRGVLPLENLRVTRSLRKSMNHYRVTVDQEFDAVVGHCADPERPGAWINEELALNYRVLHERGHAHSVEVWDSSGDLAGGLFAVVVGGLVSGEAMFRIGRDASKTALVGLVERLRAQPHPVLLDTQWNTDHLASLGVVTVTRKRYLTVLPSYLASPPVM